MRGGFGGFPGGNMNNLIKQAQKLQQDMQKTQEELENKVLEGSSGGEMLQDLVLTAVNDALNKVDEITENEMKKFNLPNMPF